MARAERFLPPPEGEKASVSPPAGAVRGGTSECDGCLLPTIVAPGAEQMALDEALLAGCGGSEGATATPRDMPEMRPGCVLPPAYPVLRFYRWSPPCISIGRNQDLQNSRHGLIDMAAARRLGIDIVRRPSGGRAILHANDLTYALVMPAPDSDITASHRLIARGLAAGLRLLGLTVDDELVALPTGRNPADCFSTVAGADLQAGGRKVMGSAQRRAHGALLEHGTLYLTPPEPLYSAVFGLPFGGSVVALDEAVGRTIGFDECADALRRGLEETLGVKFAER